MPKRTFLALLLAIVLATACVVVVYERNETDYHIEATSLENAYSISENLYGIFIEDINYAVDGGLNSNLIQNNSFEYTYILGAEEYAPFELESSFWELDGACSLATERPIATTNPTQLKVTINSGSAVAYNLGYGELDVKGGSVSVKEDKGYGLTFFANGKDFVGSVRVSVVTDEGEPLTDEKDITLTRATDYIKYTCELTAVKSGLGKFKIEALGSGTLYLDTFSLRPTDSYGYGQEEWGDSSVRLDLFNALKALNPSFVRFPGGCLAEGAFTWENDYDWKSTIGANELRVQIPNVWGYMQSMEIGFYEYFLLTEALGATAVPVVGAGVLCQARGGSGNPLDIDSPEFEEIVQNALDLIEFANGGEDTPYGALRASFGHKEPFNIKYIAVGNENWGAVYYDRFEVIYNAIKAKYPEITVISSSGPHPSGVEYDYDWARIRESFADTVVDEHYYVHPDTLEDFYERYDDFSRATNVFVGEYAAHSDYFYWWDVVTRNNMDAALSEAAFLTGIERNGDVVDMATYAPLLCKYGYQQWAPDLIWFDTDEVVLTPSYLVQYLNMNNVGSEYLPLSAEQGDGVYSSLTIDRERGKAYLKIVNATAGRVNVSAELSSLGEFEVLKHSYIRTSSLKTYNDRGKERVKIESSTLTQTDGTIACQMPKLSYSVIEIDF
ncbi:MAG: alpha-N-arabinofuranosidase [Clostridia bacterium]|nr:alpha-N-arabinofuranosidase [Clostridia bacterium]